MKLSTARMAPGGAAACAVMLLWVLLGAAGPAEAARELTLDQALELAFQHSHLLKASHQDVQAAEAQKTIARAAYLPKVEAGEIFTNTNNPAQTFGIILNQGRFTAAGFNPTTLNRPSSIENYQFQVSLIQPVYNGGREGLGVKIAALGHAASESGFERTRHEVLFAVTRAYYDMVLAKNVLVVARETVQIAESNAKQIRARYEGGTTVKSDLLQAEVRLAALREEAIRAEQSVRVAGVALQHAIGLDETVDVTDMLAVGGSPLGALEATLAGALEKRPDYQKLEVEVRKTEVGIQLARSAYLPTFNVQMSYQLNNTAPFSPNGSNNYIALGVMSLNLFNGLSDAAQVRKTRAQEERSRELLAAKRREIEVEVVEAYYGLAAAQGRLAVNDSAVAQAEENLRIVRNRYNAGLTSVIDLLTAEMVLNQAKQNRLRALYDERIGQAQLELVTGRVQRTTG